MVNGGREGEGLFETINWAGFSQIFTAQDFLRETVVLDPCQLCKKNPQTLMRVI
jgi:hypothetical protein